MNPQPLRECSACGRVTHHYLVIAPLVLCRQCLDEDKREAAEEARRPGRTDVTDTEQDQHLRSLLDQLQREQARSARLEERLDSLGAGGYSALAACHDLLDGAPGGPVPGFLLGDRLKHLLNELARLRGEGS